MNDRTYDIIAANDDILARDVPEKNLIMFLNTLMDNGHEYIVIREYEENERIMKEMVELASKKAREARSLFDNYEHPETSK